MEYDFYRSTSFSSPWTFADHIYQKNKTEEILWLQFPNFQITGEKYWEVFGKRPATTVDYLEIASSVLAFIHTRINTINSEYTNNECLWVQWYKYFHEVKDEMSHSTRWSRVEWVHFMFHRIKSFVTYIARTGKHSVLVLYNLCKDSNS